MGQSDGNLATSSHPNIEWLWSLKPWQGVGGFGLQGIVDTAALFGNPQDSFRSIHVAGTNGKGSVVSFLGAILNEAGLKTGVTISPHLSRVNERVRIGAEEISDEVLEGILGEVREKTAQNDIQLSFFETVILSSFIHFSREKVDIAVIEVGLGGRLDATNIISKPDVSVITSIGLDHQRILGETEGEIAAEKAGIIKPGVPVYVGDVSDEAFRAISAIAKEKDSPCYRFGSDFGLNEELEPSLLGAHQKKNASLAYAVTRELNIPPQVIAKGVSSTFWPGRLERLRVGETEFLIDCAHNVEGAEAVRDYLRDNSLEPMPVVTGFLNTKNWRQILDIIDNFATEFFLLRPEANQAEDLNEVHQYITSKGKLSSVHDDKYNGVISILCGTEYSGKTVLVMGSIYLVARFRELLLEKSYTEGDGLGNDG